MRCRVRTRLGADAYRGCRGMPGGVAVGRDGGGAVGAVGVRRLRDQRRDSLSSLLSSSMPNRARMHAANIPGGSRSEREARTRDASRRCGAMSLWLTGFDGVPLTRGGWTFFLPGYDARYSEELRERLVDSAFAAIDGTLAIRVRRSRHAETWFAHLDHAGGPDAYFKVLDPIRGVDHPQGGIKRPAGG